ncbi:MAG: excisionase family DNA-binding protein [Sediminibacterium sp.]|nr:excisionase family DNA-binding protein [Sediminibacterium sp.]
MLQRLRSRPHLVKLLEQGAIPFHKVGKHRRVKLKDLQTYEGRQQSIRNRELDFLVKQGQGLNMGY